MNPAVPITTAAPSKWYKLLEYFWFAVAVISFYLLFERTWISLSGENNEEGKWGAWVIGIYAIALYVLFLSEGVSHGITQLHKADREGMFKAVGDDKDLSDEKKPKLTAFLNLVFSSYQPFLIGRQIISLSAVALLAVAIEKSPDHEWLGPTLSAFVKGTIHFAIKIFPPLPSLFVEAGHHAAYLIKHFLVDFLIAFLLSALVPCWFAQILPGLLASTSSLGFLKIPGAKPCARLAIFIGRLGSGLPGQLLFRFLRKVPIFHTEERIGVGDAATFQHLTAALGECITARRIQLDVKRGSLVVTDTITVELSARPRSRINQTLRVATSYCPASQISLHAPTGYHFPVLGGLSSKAAIIKINDIKTDAEITTELLMFAEATFETPLPRSTSKGEQVTFQFYYTCTALSLDPDIGQLFFFEISKPTQLLEIVLNPDQGLFCQPVDEMRYGHVEELQMRRRDILGDENIRFESEKVGEHSRKLSKLYPRSGRYGLLLNAMAFDPSRSAAVGKSP
jgi:hypothetical protein